MPSSSDDSSSSPATAPTAVKRPKLLPPPPTTGGAAAGGIPAPHSPIRLPPGMQWKLTPNAAKFIDFTTTTTNHPQQQPGTAAASSSSNRFWDAQCDLARCTYAKYVCLVSSSSFPAATGTGRSLVDVIGSYNQSWHELLAFHIRTQGAIQPDGLVYPCFLDWFARRMIEKVSIDAYARRMSDLASFLAQFNISDFELECTRSDFVLHEWRRFLNPKEELFRVERTTLTNVAKSIIACKQMKLYISSSASWLQTKLSLYLSFTAAVFTGDNVNSYTACQRLVRRDLDRRALVERGLRVVGSAIALFLTPGEQRKVASAFRFSDDIVSAFTVNLASKQECEAFVLASINLTGDRAELLQRVKASGFLATYNCLLLRAASYPKKKTLGRQALLSELDLKVMRPSGVVRREIARAVSKPKDFAVRQADDEWIDAQLASMRALECTSDKSSSSSLLDDYLASEFHATLPEFLACWQLKVCLQRIQRSHEYDSLREKMLREARSSLKSWDNIRIKLLHELTATTTALRRGSGTLSKVIL